jgi:hypothetical protein
MFVISWQPGSGTPRGTSASYVRAVLDPPGRGGDHGQLADRARQRARRHLASIAAAYLAAIGQQDRLAGLCWR